MKILKCEILAGREHLLEAMKVCYYKYDEKPKKMRNKLMRESIIAEHGSLNRFVFSIVAEVTDRVHSHLRTHYLINEFYQCSTSRPDLTKNDGTNRMISFYLPAKRLLEMFEVRRCNRAWKDTKIFLLELEKYILVLEPQFRGLLVESCVKRGYCKEQKKCCGFIKTNAYKEIRKDFLINVGATK